MKKLILILILLLTTTVINAQNIELSVDEAIELIMMDEDEDRVYMICDSLIKLARTESFITVMYIAPYPSTYTHTIKQTIFGSDIIKIGIWFDIEENRNLYKKRM